MDCVFCTLPEIKERTISRDDFAWAFLTNIPITTGHTLVCPVRHVQKFEELTAEERIAIFNLAARTKTALRELFGAEGFNVAWNEGETAGQAVPHFHLHVVPRKPGDEGITEYEPRKFLYRPGSREKTPESELSMISEEMRKKLPKN